MERSVAKSIQELLSDYGLVCSDEQSRLLDKHLELVIEKNKVLNLTRITNVAEAVVLHVVDSLLLLCCEGVKLTEQSKFVDMGTGAGFPGIPLGIMTGAQGMLVDSVGKKVAAVQEFIETLGLENLIARHARVEDLAVDLCGSQDVVVARALARTNILVEYATPFLKKGGKLVVAKARPEEEEVAEADRAAKICGLRRVSRETFELPEGLGHREILVYEKIGSARIKLPRKAGTAKREPLGVQ